jgi:hypothetical protein
MPGVLALALAKSVAPDNDSRVYVQIRSKTYKNQSVLI